MKITLAEPLSVSPQIIEDLARPVIDRGHQFVCYDQLAADDSELIERCRDSDAVIIANHPFRKEVIENCPQLKMLDVAFTGIDHVALEACKEKGITVCNASGYSTQTVAELVIAMAIDAYRKITLADRTVRSGGTSAGIGGREICGKTVGIIGLGKIGMACARLFKAFGANVIAFNRSINKEALEMGVAYRTLDEVLSESDIISLNLPNNSETRGLISVEKIALMKPTAVFINCARGPIVDNSALADALNEGRLGYACIDVYDMEPPIPEDYPLLNARNTLLTPHQGFISEEAMIRRAQIVFANLIAWLDGNPQNVCRL